MWLPKYISCCVCRSCDRRWRSAWRAFCDGQKWRRLLLFHWRTRAMLRYRRFYFDWKYRLSMFWNNYSTKTFLNYSFNIKLFHFFCRWKVSHLLVPKLLSHRNAGRGTKRANEPECFATWWDRRKGETHFVHLRPPEQVHCVHSACQDCHGIGK